MCELRDQMARLSGMELLIHQSPEAEVKGINPFDHVTEANSTATSVAAYVYAARQCPFD